jgi:hypothetical protein
MPFQKSKRPEIVRCTFWHHRFSWGLLMFTILIGLPGCQQLPGSQAMRQYQVESDRLVNEFRAQKKRAEELEARNNQLEQRLAESEKMLARAQNNSGRRIGRNNSSSELLIGDANDAARSSSLSSSDSSRASANRSNRSRGLPDIANPTNGRFTSTGSADPLSLGAGRDLRGDPNRDSQWRPITNPAR